MRDDPGGYHRDRALLAAAITDTIEQIADHEARLHREALQHRPTGPLEAIPHNDETIPDADLVRAIHLGEEGHSLEAVAAMLGYSPWLLERFLGAYRARYGALVDSWRAPL